MTYLLFALVKIIIAQEFLKTAFVVPASEWDSHK